MKLKTLTLILLLESLLTYSQKEYRVFDWKTESALNLHLLQQMQGSYEERAILFQNALKSRDSMAEYITGIKQKFTQLLGDLPATSPLNPMITERAITYAGKPKDKIVFEYRIERVVFESFPGHHVTANLYVPTSRGLCNTGSPYPAVLFFCGHEDAGKATPSYQQTAAMLAAYGNVVLVVDPISQSERHQLTGAAGKPLTRGGTTEHTLINAGANLVGTSTASYELWDNKRALDYLLTRQEVDTSRIGCAGNSGGAIQAIYFAAFEPRIKVIAVVSYLASRERTFDLTGAPDGCALIPGEGKALLEMSDLLIAASPKPLLVVAGRFDFIDYTATLQSYRELEKVYALLGDPGKLRLITHQDGHGIGPEKRVDVVNWFREWFRPTDECFVVDQSDAIRIHADTALFSSKTGQVNTAFRNEVTVFERNLALADSLAENRRKFMRRPREEVLENIARLVDIKPRGREGIIGYSGDVTINGINFRKVPVMMKGAAPVALLQAFRGKAAQKKIIVWLHSSGKQVIADSVALLRKYLDQGAAVFIADLPGIGELQDVAALNDPKYFNKEYRTAMLAIHNGSSLIAQRTLDIIDLVEIVAHSTQWSSPIVELHAEGHLALSALHAVALMDDRKVAALKLYNCITSFKDILKDPIKKDWYSFVVPGVLKYYDIPDLVNLIGNGKIEFINLQK